MLLPASVLATKKYRPGFKDVMSILVAKSPPRPDAKSSLLRIVQEFTGLLELICMKFLAGFGKSETTAFSISPIALGT